MVVIDENSTEIKIPRHNKEYNGRFMIYLSAPSYPSLTLVNKCFNISTNTKFWTFNINGNKPENIGEYTYEVVDVQSNDIVENGLLIYGDYVREEVKSINNKQKNVQLKYGK